ncbi:hypothetical protein ACO0SA_001264 [Hanseniaspora valbyensis]
MKQSIKSDDLNDHDEIKSSEDGSLILEELPKSADTHIVSNGTRSRQGSSFSLRNRNRSRGSSIASNILETIDSITIHNEQTDIDTKDPGLNSELFYEKKMSPLRFKIRHFLLTFVKDETKPLLFIQNHCRNFIFDEYFIYSANLGSHFFYVICLPMTRWIPISDKMDYSRDLIYLLAYSIYFSGFIKDYLCLPRPKAPPIIRITHSEYTTKEYGAPSSHTANATAVTLYVILQLFANLKNVPIKKSLLYFGLIGMYYTTLSFGRLYSGMHGFFDLESGALIGLLTLILRLGSKKMIDYNLLTNGSIFYPIIQVIIGFTLLFCHTHPIELCPCFEDSVSFIGVVGGLEISDWICCNFGEKWFPWVTNKTPQNLYFQLPLPRSSDNWYKIIGLRLLVGVTLVLLWKEVITVYITKKIFKLKTTSILSNKTLKQVQVKEYEALPYKVIIWRYWIYAGIAIVSCFVAPLFFVLFGLL